MLPPLLLIRYGLLFLVNKSALKRAAFFPPMMGGERTAYWVYQLSTVLIFVSLCFLPVQADWQWFGLGLGVYMAGVVIFAVATFNFAHPSKHGLNSNGLYRVSRNPMYVGYFVFFLGCALLTKSIMLFILLLGFQISAHWIILAEERWCEREVGEEYTQYMKKVRRYL